MVDSRTLARYLEGDDYEPTRRFRQVVCGETFQPFQKETKAYLSV